MERPIVMFGNPVDGFRFVGPFESVEDAIDYIDRAADKDMWIVALEELVGH